MAHPRAANCVLDGNPLHEEQLAIVSHAGRRARAQHRDRRPAAARPSSTSARSSRAISRRWSSRRLRAGAGPRRFHTVVTSAAGYPLDKTYYQTVKGMVGPLDILEPGGDLIVASACAEGIGRSTMSRRSGAWWTWAPTASRRASRASSTPTSTSGRPRCSSSRCAVGRVRLYTDGLDTHDAALTGVERVTDLTSAIAESMARHRDPRVAFVPEGPYVVPVQERA